MADKGRCYPFHNRRCCVSHASSRRCNRFGTSQGFSLSIEHISDLIKALETELVEPIYLGTSRVRIGGSQVGYLGTGRPVQAHALLVT